MRLSKEKNILGEKGENNFVLIYYKDKSNREQPMYNITKIGALQLAARYDAVVRFNLIEKVIELSKNETNSTENIIDDPKKARLQKAYDDLEYTRNVLQIKKEKLILQEKYLKLGRFFNDHLMLNDKMKFVYKWVLPVIFSLMVLANSIYGMIVK